jgi:hypothetical protein
LLTLMVYVPALPGTKGDGDAVFETESSADVVTGDVMVEVLLLSAGSVVAVATFPLLASDEPDGCAGSTVTVIVTKGVAPGTTDPRGQETSRLAVL